MFSTLFSCGQVAYRYSDLLEKVNIECDLGWDGTNFWLGSIGKPFHSPDCLLFDQVLIFLAGCVTSLKHLL
jgi:hypothetical protein